VAKLKAPLLSLGASGQIAKSLVFFPWKGLDVVREYVVPSNPKTDAQNAQRAYITTAVALIHAAQAQTPALGAAEVTAYALWASVVRPHTTWFNQAVKNCVDQGVAILTPLVFRGGKTTPGADKLDVEVTAWQAVPTAGYFAYGTSKTALINTKAATMAGTKASASITLLTTGVKYFWQFVVTTPATLVGNKSGIYYGVPT